MVCFLTERFILATIRITELEFFPKLWNVENSKYRREAHKKFETLFWTLTARLRDIINRLFAKVNKTKNHSFSNCDNASSFPESCEKCSLLCSLATVDWKPTDFTKIWRKFQIQICSVNSKSRPAKNNLQQVFHFDEFFQFEEEKWKLVSCENDVSAKNPSSTPTRRR